MLLDATLLVQDRCDDCGLAAAIHALGTREARNSSRAAGSFNAVTGIAIPA
jgi:hypothetical protein